jgi:membrane-associated phospholipid phosphatase
MQLKSYFYDWLGYNQIIFNKISMSFNDDLSFKISGLLSYYVGNDHKLYYHIIIIYVSLFIYTLYQYDKNNKNLRIQLFQIVFVMVFSYIISNFVINSLKDYFSYLRPYCNEQIKIPNIIKSIYSLSLKECNKSFPSGHTNYTTVMILSLWPIMNYQFKSLGLILILAVGTSRIILARHYPADVLAGYLIGNSTVFLISFIFIKIQRRFFKT